MRFKTVPEFNGIKDEDALLVARAILIKSGDFPLAWVTRQPTPDEVAALLRILIKAEPNPRKKATVLVGAIVAADKERGDVTFQEENPVTFFALQQHSKNGFVTQKELEIFQASCK